MTLSPLAEHLVAQPPSNSVSASPVPVPLSTYKCKGPVIFMSDGHPWSCKVREACQHPVCPSTCLLPAPFAFGTAFGLECGRTWLLTVCSSPGSQAWDPPVVLFIVGMRAVLPGQGAHFPGPWG